MLRHSDLFPTWSSPSAGIASITRFLVSKSKCMAHEDFAFESFSMLFRVQINPSVIAGQKNSIYTPIGYADACGHR